MTDEKNEAVSPDVIAEPAPEAAPEAIAEAAPAAASEAASEADPETTPVAPARTGRVKKAARYVVPAVLVLGVIGGAGAYTRTTADSADRTAPTTLWTKEEARDSLALQKGGTDRGRAARTGRSDTALSKLLLPVAAPWEIGPDIGKLSNDNEVSGKEAAAAVKKSIPGLAGKERRAYEKSVDGLKIQGMAQRSYVSATMDSSQKAVIGILSMKDTGAVKDLWVSNTGLMDEVGVFRKGPKIADHKEARCFRAPKSDTKLDGVTCVAYEGELFITVAVEGTEPMDMSIAADLVKDQLDHIKSPGEYI
ncbi:hypothetical protein OG599_15485 [Streptomyces sp. NBC_01335]|uniref:hypothetical protein n=1 Tax=Streptomyces sp. NBC_01335 TaxID=2903828 RepID=UPI002E0EA042|nr:hypothetical protein OG599_15485 [Streptomyces sp. NBC_01335]